MFLAQGEKNNQLPYYKKEAKWVWKSVRVDPTGGAGWPLDWINKLGGILEICSHELRCLPTYVVSRYFIQNQMGPRWFTGSS